MARGSNFFPIQRIPLLHFTLLENRSQMRKSVHLSHQGCLYVLRFSPGSSQSLWEQGLLSHHASTANIFASSSILRTSQYD